MSDGLGPATPGRLAVTIGGLPAASGAAVTVTGPNGFAALVTASQQLAGLVPGSYTVSATAVTVAGTTWEPTAASQVVSVPNGGSAAVVVEHVATTGALAVAIAGLPAGVPAAVVVTGPGGFTSLVATPTTLTGLTPGAYTIVASPVSVADDQYSLALPVQEVVVAAGAAPLGVTVSYALTTGRLQVQFGGAPVGAPLAVVVAGPAGYSEVLSQGATLAGLAPGTYTVTAPGFTMNGFLWAASPPVQVVQVAATPVPAAASVLWSPVTGSLNLVLAGLPYGQAAGIMVSGPGGFQRQVAASELLTGLVPGQYQIAASQVAAGGLIWLPTPGAQAVNVVAGATAAAGLAWTLQPGALAVTVAGLPGSTAAAVSVTGPDEFAATLAATGVLTNLAPGSYTIAASSVSAGGSTWLPLPPSQTVTVGSGASAATVAYSVHSGSLAVTISGLPSSGASVTVTGPGGFAQSLTASGTLLGLVPGTYQVTAASVVLGGSSYAPTPPQQAVVVSSGAAASASIAYAVQIGSLTVAISGLPSAGAQVSVTGPGGFAQSLAASTALAALTPGTYQVTASPVVLGGITYAPTPGSQQVQVSAGAAASASVTYAPTTGAIAVTIAGLPGGTVAAVTLSGPGGASHQLTSSQTVGGLAVGSWTVSAATVVSGGITYAPSPASQAVSVTGGGTANRTVTYAPTTGAIAVTISGLPGGTAAAVTLSGPGGASHQLTASQTLGGLAVGSWTLSAASVLSGGTTYAPAPTSQGVSVTGGGTAGATVTYSAAPASSLNLRVEGAYLTQAIQRLDHGVELVAGRDAYLRVFAVANEANAVQPRVRVRLYHGATLVQTWQLNAPGAAVPQALNEGSLSASWNVLVPGALVQPSLRMLVDVDPDGWVVEGNETDNSFPTSGTPQAITVRTLLPFQIRLVPVLQSVNALQGDVTAGNADGYLADMRAMMPIGAYDVDVRAVYTTNAPELQSNNGNNAWGTVLSEVLALRNAVDQSSRYYYGVVRTTYSSGIAGMGYVGSPSSSVKAAIGWDRTGSRAGVLAHELGHNFGRSHAPCGGPGGPDPAYPHAGGQIGAWGLDVATLSLKAPTTWFDLMGYCNNDWVSDYTWNAVVNFRAASPTGAPPMAASSGGDEDGMLIWGRITPSGVVLEPAFRVAPTGQPLPSSGAWRVEGRDASGGLVFSQRFDPTEVADLPGGREQHFALVVPLGRARLDQVVSLRVVGAPGSSERRAGPTVSDPSADPVLSPGPVGRRRLTWDASRHPMAMVRDPVSGEILSFARGGAILLWSGAGALDIQLSDGVRAVRRRVAVQ